MKVLTKILLSTLLLCLSVSFPLHAKEQRVRFQSGGNILAGYYLSTEKTTDSKGVILFVHGDGALSYDAYGYYEPIWQRLIDNGYAVFSWDKPGVGDSTGNWLNQSMQDRQQEVHDAIAFVKNHFRHQAKSLGLMGFSQAGWVVPAVAKNNDEVDFFIGVGFAINWMQQSWYLTKTRLEASGASESDIAKAYQHHLQEIAFWQAKPTYADYQTHYASQPDLMSEERFHFAKLNAFADASHDYQNLTKPGLILLGEQDLNVDINHTHRRLSKLFEGKNSLTIKRIANATHSLLKHPTFNTQTPGTWFLIKLYWYGDEAYAREFFDTLDTWLSQVTQAQ
ncbi:alpha/beta hydrolase family protein [Vibrio navarrensis]|uniref:alpha/beta hydrolase family protein n=1 Tax=Vibrio navarrensis TaxID=29495 RepID=UPI001559635D|nr:alpha/beta hydrolase [Vibrio navarrensis]